MPHKKTKGLLKMRDCKKCNYFDSCSLPSFYPLSVLSECSSYRERPLHSLDCDMDIEQSIQKRENKAYYPLMLKRRIEEWGFEFVTSYFYSYALKKCTCGGNEACSNCQ